MSSILILTGYISTIWWLFNLSIKQENKGQQQAMPWAKYLCQHANMLMIIFVVLRDPVMKLWNEKESVNLKQSHVFITFPFLCSSFIVH